MGDMTFSITGTGGFLHLFLRKGEGLVSKEFQNFFHDEFYIIKKRNVVSIFTRSYSNGVMVLGAFPYENAMKFLVFGANLNFAQFIKFYMKDISYWIAQ